MVGVGWDGMGGRTDHAAAAEEGCVGCIYDAGGCELGDVVANEGDLGVEGWRGGEEGGGWGCGGEFAVFVEV